MHFVAESSSHSIEFYFDMFRFYLPGFVLKNLSSCECIQSKGEWEYALAGGTSPKTKLASSCLLALHDVIIWLCARYIMYLEPRTVSDQDQ